MSSDIDFEQMCREIAQSLREDELKKKSLKKRKKVEQEDSDIEMIGKSSSTESVVVGKAPFSDKKKKNPKPRDVGIWGAMKPETTDKKKEQAKQHFVISNILSKTSKMKESPDPFGVNCQTFDLIYADPPWGYDRRWTKGSALEHYPTMAQADIEALPVAKLANRNCMCLLWVTSPKMEDGLKVLKAWGFKYKTVFFTWVKTTKDGRPRMGMGNYTRPSTELVLLGYKSEIQEDTDICLVGTRGNVLKMKQSCSTSQIIMQPPREHSRKPDELIIDRLEEFFGDNYEDIKKIELFARQPKRGWACWGNQIEKFEDPKPTKLKAKIKKHKKPRVGESIADVI